MNVFSWYFAYSSKLLNFNNLQPTDKIFVSIAIIKKKKHNATDSIDYYLRITSNQRKKTKNISTTKI